MRTAGMGLAGLPDVVARGGEEQDEALREAARFMTRQNRELRRGDRFASEGAVYELVGEREGLLEIARVPAWSNARRAGEVGLAV